MDIMKDKLKQLLSTLCSYENEFKMNYVSLNNLYEKLDSIQALDVDESKAILEFDLFMIGLCSLISAAVIGSGFQKNILSEGIILLIMGLFDLTAIKSLAKRAKPQLKIRKEKKRLEKIIAVRSKGKTKTKKKWFN